MLTDCGHTSIGDYVSLLSIHALPLRYKAGNRQSKDAEGTIIAVNSTVVTDGIKIRRGTEKVKKSRRKTRRLILRDYPRDVIDRIKDHPYEYRP